MTATSPCSGTGARRCGLLAAGDSVPADVLLALKNLQVEEAALTGESVPVEKRLDAVPAEAVIGDRTCMVYSGTLVTSGTASAIVVAQVWPPGWGGSPTC